MMYKGLRVLVVTVAFATVTISGTVKAANTESDRFLVFLNQIYDSKLAESPMLATSFGSRENYDIWDDFSDKALKASAETVRRDLERASEHFDPDKMDARTRLQYHVFVEEQKLLLDRYRWRDHFYPLNQIVGLHVEVPGILVNQHMIDNKSDAEAYINRLRLVKPLFGQLIHNTERLADEGFMMPESIYPRLIGGAEKIISGAPFEQGEDNPIWSDFKRKINLLELATADKEALLDKARSALLGPFKEGYVNLISVLERHEKETDVDGGAWQLPDGDEFYAFLIRQFTTTDMTPEQVHQLGLAEAARIRGEMMQIVEQVGFAGGLEAFMQDLKTNPKFYYDNTDEGRVRFMERARQTVDAMKARTTDVFLARPPIELVVKRFEAYREKSSPAAYYEAGSADGRRPGYIYLNLYDMSKVATYDLDALLYHEGIPGHHMQISTILTDGRIPELRKLNPWWLNSAFVEGWALYAEHLAKDMGFYQDPYADFGRLAAELWRAYRLVVDSGLHYKRWTREQAIEFLNKNTSSPEQANIRAVDRYLAVPGQATSFMVGMKTFLDLRESARQDLGDKFDIRQFHNIVLQNGYIPLWATREAVEQWVSEKSGKPAH